MSEEDNLHIVDEESEKDSDNSSEEENMTPKTGKPKTFGILITVFIAVLVIMIGSLASYYYYTFQSKGSANQQSVRDSWNEVVLATMDLTNAFADVENFDGLISEDKDGFADSLGGVNRSLRDVFYNLQGSQGYVFSGNTFVSRFNNFLDDYLAYLRQVQRLVDRGEAG